MIVDRRMLRCRTSEKIEFPNSKAFVSSCMPDNRAGGVFMETSAPLPIDAQGALRMNLPGDRETMGIQGHVVWNKSFKSFSAGMGFHCINPSQKQSVTETGIKKKVVHAGCSGAGQ